jgi:hypothetical protein
MSNLDAAATRLAFDDILEAVQESRRGRWFLQEYEARLQQRDSKSILDAINRLEARVGSMGASAPDELSRVRNAISNARNDLLKLGMGKQALSPEGKIFAQLAELARKSMPADSSATVVRGLQLVDEIERAVIPANNDHGGKYFTADAQIFQTPPVAAKPVLVEKPEPVVQIKKSDEPVQTGAKLVIRKANAEIDAAPASPVAQPAPEPLKQEAVVPAVEVVTSDHPRISIVRRKPEDMNDVTDDSASAA